MCCPERSLNVPSMFPEIFHHPFSIWIARIHQDSAEIPKTRLRLMTLTCLIVIESGFQFAVEI
jgi:hypothetical protein